jgi:diguanylate cyclase (GGDEF)-like protein
MLTEQIERTKRLTYRFSIALFDLDHFKAINDTYGHRVGDEVLIRVAAALRQSVREFDIVGRYGGEEFMLILPHTDLLEASVIAERVRADVKDLTWPGSPLSVTLSGGVCAYAGTNLDDLVDDVDQKLYAAKAAGRDRIIG